MCDERGKETNSPYGMDKEDRRSWQGDMCVMYQDHCYCHKLYCSYCCISFVDFFYFNYYFIFIKVCWNFKFLKLYFPKIDTILMKSTVLKKNTKIQELLGALPLGHPPRSCPWTQNGGLRQVPTPPAKFPLLLSCSNHIPAVVL